MGLDNVNKLRTQQGDGVRWRCGEVAAGASMQASGQGAAFMPLALLPNILISEVHVLREPLEALGSTLSQFG